MSAARRRPDGLKRCDLGPVSEDRPLSIAHPAVPSRDRAASDRSLPESTRASPKACLISRAASSSAKLLAAGQNRLHGAIPWARAALVVDLLGVGGREAAAPSAPDAPCTSIRPPRRHASPWASRSRCAGRPAAQAGRAAALERRVSIEAADARPAADRAGSSLNRAKRVHGQRRRGMDRQELRFELAAVSRPRDPRRTAAPPRPGNRLSSTLAT